KIADRVDNLLVLRRIPNHSTLPHRPFTDFELRFDQGDDVARRAQKITDPREHQAQGDEGNVDDGEVRRCGELDEAADIDPLQDDHAGVLAKFPRQLSVADVDRDHPLRATLQEDVCKAAGRRTHIEAVTAARIDGEGVECRRQLLPTSADVIPRAGEFDRLVGRDHLVRSLRHRAADSHQTGPYHHLRPFAGGRKAALDQRLVKAPAFRHHHRHSPRPITTPRSAPAMTSIGVWPSSSRSRTWWMPRWAMNRSSSSRLRIIACWPAARRTPVASYITTELKISARANSGDSTPWSRPMMVVSDTTSALCELGIPPAVASRRTLSRRKSTESMITLLAWAITHATSGTTKYGFRSRLTGRVAAHRPEPAH